MWHVGKEGGEVRENGRKEAGGSDDDDDDDDAASLKRGGGKSKAYAPLPHSFTRHLHDPRRAFGVLVVACDKAKEGASSPGGLGERLLASSCWP